MQFHRLVVSDIHRETEDTVTIRFQIPENLKDDFKFIPGQYLTLKTDINGEEVRRPYSISSGTDETELRVAVKKIEGGVFSTFANDVLKTGDEMEVLPPIGRFVVEPDKNNSKNYLLVAVGSGITPMLSIMKSVLADEPDSEVTLIYGNRRFDSIIFREEIENLKDQNLGRLRVFHILSREKNEIDLFQGRIDGEKVLNFFNSFLDFSECDGVYLCGPEDMIMSVKDVLVEKGMSKDDIHFELFVTNRALEKSGKAAEKKIDSSDKKIDVSVTLDGQKWDFKMAENVTILDAASAEGLDLPHSCKGGMCCTCKAKLQVGEVDMKLNYALEDEEVEDGYILTCQSLPKTNRVDVNFDV